MSYKINIQNVNKTKNIPKKNSFKDWITAALQQHCDNAEITIRIVDENEMTLLNQQYRNKKGPTNILSFPYKFSVNSHQLLTGDLVICGSVVLQEAQLQQKTVIAHWAHLIIHGALHLLGYDHMTDEDAKNMENLEITILKSFGFSNPYLEHINGK